MEEITSASTDLNNCNKAGVVYYWGNIEPVNSPFSWGALENIIKQGDAWVQICRYRASNVNERKIVWRTFEGGTWTSWYQIYDESILTDSTLLSPLASVLGVDKWVEVQGTKNTPVSLPKTGSGRVFLFSPTLTSANMLCIGTDSGADKLNNPWYSNNVTFGIDNGTCTVTWTQNWTSVFIYIIGY